MERDLQNAIAHWNADCGQELDLSVVAEIYGEDIVERMYEYSEDVISNVEFLLELEFEESVTDIVHRFGLILLEDPCIFRENVQNLIQDLGEDYVERLGEDMSPWESLL